MYCTQKSNKMEWSEVRILEFLELYQKEELIWNPKHRNHKNRQKSNDAWNRISTTMKLPVNDLKLKKNSLMACFRSHLRKKKSSIRSGIGADDIYEPAWFAFKLMEDFLASVYDCGETIDTEENTTSPSNEEHDKEPQSDQTGYTEDQDIEIIHHSESPPERTDHHSRVHIQSSRDSSSDFPAPTSQRQKRRQLASEISDAQKKIKQTFETLNTVINQKKPAEDDECDLYGKLLAKKLRNYAEYERHLIMHEIDGLLIKNPPRIISNISRTNSYPTSVQGQDSTDSLLSHVDSPSQSCSGLHKPSSAPTPMPSRPTVHTSIPKIQSSPTNSYPSPSSIRRPVASPKSVTSSLPSITIPKRLFPAAATFARLPSQSPHTSPTPMSKTPVRINIPSRSSAHGRSAASFTFTPMSSLNSPNRTSTSYAPFQSHSPDKIISKDKPMPSSTSTIQSNKIHVLSEEVISPSIDILQDALTNAEIDEYDFNDLV